MCAVSGLSDRRSMRAGILQVAGIRGLPSNMSEDAYVTFRFFLDEQPVSTPKHTKKTINPKFNFKHSWNLVVTDELCSYLSSDVLEFIVYAKNSGTGTGGGGADAAGAFACCMALLSKRHTPFTRHFIVTLDCG